MKTKKINKRTLNVKLTSAIEIKEKWGFYPISLTCGVTMNDLLMPVYARCNSKGEIKDFDKTSVYNHKDLIGKKIIIHK